ncbi:MAG: hypothetical protein WCG29_07475 [Desulfomonile sp.]|nr:hypothetical protein [Deltaproteobacteria bacterium]
MTGCRSCSDRLPETCANPAKTAEKLEKGERSGNSRYPLVFVGSQAIYSENGIQMIVTVLADDCDGNCDLFTLKPTRILKDSTNGYAIGQSFDVTQPAGENCWKLQALL